MQGDIRDRANCRNDCDKHGETARLAVACRDKVGDRSEILPLADLDDAMDHPPAEEDDDHRAEVDRQVSPAVFGGRADGTVEGPGRAVDGECQPVDCRTRRAREFLRVRDVAPVRDRKQDRDVPERQEQQRPPTDQGRSPPHAGGVRAPLFDARKSTTIVESGRIRGRFRPCREGCKSLERKRFSGFAAIP